MFDLTLTFDNGPDPATTPAVLGVLREHGVLASFFAVGRRLAEPGGLALATQAHAEGHWIGNHTWSHDIPLGERDGPGLAEAELGATQRVIGALAHDHRWFRPFGGGGNLDRRLLNPAVVDHLARHRMSCVLWNAVPRDWAEPEGWVETAWRQCLAQPWTLMVLHDLPTGAMRHLPRFLDGVRARGGRFRQDFPPECVPMLDGRRRPELENFVARPTIALES